MRAAAATLRAAAAEVWADRSSLRVQVVAMVANDLAWVVFWVLVLDRVGSLRGWDTHRVLLLQATLTTAGGLALGLCGNARRVGTLAADGGLDAALALPVHPLAHLLTRRIDPVYLGDIVFGVGLFAVVGATSAGRVAVFAGAVVAGAVVVGGFLVAVGSLSLFTGRREPGELGFHALLLLASYPSDLFTGLPRLLVYTVVPGAFVATVPATIVDRFDGRLAAVLVVAAATAAVVGWATFTLGLRRYTSGSAWTGA